MSGAVETRSSKKKDRDPILPLDSPSIQTCNTVLYIFNIRITIWIQ